MKLKLADNNPVNMVGDGKRPNRYWVTASTDFDYVHGEDGVSLIDHADDLMKDHGIASDSIPVDAVFTTYAEAVEYAESQDMPGEPEPGQINRLTIEDRLSGEVWQRILVAYPRTWGGWHFETETTHEINFTRETMGDDFDKED